MRLGKKLNDAVMFAKFATLHGLEPRDLAEFIALARIAFAAGEHGGRKEQKAADAFAEKATTLGFGVAWSGLWPTLTKNGQDICLPSMD